MPIRKNGYYSRMNERAPAPKPTRSECSRFSRKLSTVYSLSLILEAWSPEEPPTPGRPYEHVSTYTKRSVAPDLAPVPEDESEEFQVENPKPCMDYSKNAPPLPPFLSEAPVDLVIATLDGKGVDTPKKICSGLSKIRQVVALMGGCTVILQGEIPELAVIAHSSSNEWTLTKLLGFGGPKATPSKNKSGIGLDLGGMEPRRLYSNNDNILAVHTKDNKIRFFKYTGDLDFQLITSKGLKDFCPGIAISKDRAFFVEKPGRQIDARIVTFETLASETENTTAGWNTEVKSLPLPRQIAIPFLSDDNKGMILTFAKPNIDGTADGKPYRLSAKQCDTFVGVGHFRSGTVSEAAVAFNVNQHFVLRTPPAGGGVRVTFDGGFEFFKVLNGASEISISKMVSCGTMVVGLANDDKTLRSVKVTNVEYKKLSARKPKTTDGLFKVRVKNQDIGYHFPNMGPIVKLFGSKDHVLFFAESEGSKPPAESPSKKLTYFDSDSPEEDDDGYLGSVAVAGATFGTPARKI